MVQPANIFPGSLHRLAPRRQPPATSRNICCVLSNPNLQPRVRADSELAMVNREQDTKVHTKVLLTLSCLLVKSSCYRYREIGSLAQKGQAALKHYANHLARPS